MDNNTLPDPQGIWGKVLNVDEAFWNAVKFTAAPGVLLMLGINWWNFTGWQLINIMITIIGFVLWWQFAIKPTHLKYASIGGAVWNAPGNPIKGSAAGIAKLAEITHQIGYFWLLIGFSLSTWSFSENLAAFPIVVVAALILTFTTKMAGVWRVRVVTIYGVICIVAALWSTFNGSWRGDAFDQCTGQALYLVDPQTGHVHGKRAATECDNPSFSPETGKPLVKMGSEQAIRRNPLTAPGAVIEGAVESIKGVACPEPIAFTVKDDLAGTLPSTRLKQGCDTVIHVEQGVDWNIRFVSNHPELIKIGKPVEVFFTHSWLGRQLTLTPKPDFPVPEAEIAAVNPLEASRLQK